MEILREDQLMIQAIMWSNLVQGVIEIGHCGVVELPDEDAIAVDVAPPIHIHGGREKE